VLIEYASLWGNTDRVGIDSQGYKESVNGLRD
jgi:hypothetical protein